ncbi:MAG: HAD family hydrolase [Cyanobacteria bacterium J06559_3]
MDVLKVLREMCGVKKAAVLFDIDGTVIESKKFHLSSWIQALCEIQPGSKNVADLIGGGSDLAIMQSVLKDISLSGATKVSLRKAEIFAQIVEDEILPLIEGFRQFVDGLKKSDVRVGAYTNCCRETADLMLRNAGIADCFEIYICADDVISAKPNGEGYTLLCELFNVDPHEAVIFEDSLTGVNAGIDAGIDIIYVGTSSEDIAKLVVRSIESFEDLLT